jgi:hypothetical protein
MDDHAGSIPIRALALIGIAPRNNIYTKEPDEADSREISLVPNYLEDLAAARTLTSKSRLGNSLRTQSHFHCFRATVLVVARTGIEP